MSEQLNRPGRGRRDPWETTSYMFAGFLLLSLSWNGVVTAKLLGGWKAPDPAPAAAPQGAALARNPAAEGRVGSVGPDDDPVVGSKDAPVEIIEFADYECSFCARFHNETFTRIKADYIDSGRVRFVFRDFPMTFHPRAEPAAVAAECVREIADDEAYYAYQSLLFGGGGLSDAALKAAAEKVGVRGEDFDACAADADGARVAEIAADRADGMAVGVTGTPTIFINGRPIVGAQPYEAFKAAIEAELR